MWTLLGPGQFAQYIGVSTFHSSSYSETCVNGHLYSETTCIKRPLCDVPKVSAPYILTCIQRPPLYKGHYEGALACPHFRGVGPFRSWQKVSSIARYPDFRESTFRGSTGDLTLCVCMFLQSHSLLSVLHFTVQLAQRYL